MKRLERGGAEHPCRTRIQPDRLARDRARHRRHRYIRSESPEARSPRRVAGWTGRWHATPPAPTTSPDRSALRRRDGRRAAGRRAGRGGTGGGGRALVEQMADPQAHAMITIADGFVALVSGEFDSACARLEDALTVARGSRLCGSRR